MNLILSCSSVVLFICRKDKARNSTAAEHQEEFYEWEETIK